ncbi:N-acylglucosamine 2-epimerase-like [Babylonia areolata]|uniref:N-acylglucosamine 2-epimerase-like n=1 Tax=Babylonia areolata TaxID=304850 RepID=UPI003FD5B16F
MEEVEEVYTGSRAAEMEVVGGEACMGSPGHSLKEMLGMVRADLDRTVNFWLRNSHDLQCGGFFTCLGEDGHMYDDTKYTWLQSRQVWMYARLYNELDRFRTAEMLEAAVNGGQFVMSHVKRPDGTWKCYFSLTRQGQPLRTQRTLFAECFYMLAMAELFRATGDQKYRGEAVNMLNQIVHWARQDDSALGRERLSGQTGVSTLAVPMMLLYLTQELTTTMGDPSLTAQYEDAQQWCVTEILKHVQRGGSVVLENVSADGQELPGSAGRLVNPGHAIEAGWFLLRRVQATQDSSLQQVALSTFITASFRRGWDPQHGGLFSFLDVDDESPVQLEWDMKLWWPHCETLVALLMGYSVTKDAQLLRQFSTVFDYVYSHFVDKKQGEWYGYLNRRGDITHRFKGGPWKGFFHVPRCLLMCETMLEKLVSENTQQPSTPVTPTME